MINQHYATYLHNFSNATEINDYEEFLATLGKKGVKNNTILKNTDRITRIINTNFNKLKEKFNLKQTEALINIVKNQIKHINMSYNSTEELTLSDSLKESKLYYTFKIPKSTGGWRVIEAPVEELKRVQDHLVFILKFSYALLEHNQAHGYVKHKSVVTNAKYHQKSNHFGRVDIKDFFPSISTEMLDNILPKIGRLTLADGRNGSIDGTLTRDLIDIIKNTATLRGTLPQGGVTSPYLSNLIMIPFDYHMTELLKEKHPNILYTRYADDLFFSSFYAFADRKEDAKEFLTEIVKQAMRNAYGKEYFVIKKEKTKVTTKYGANRITGIKINKDNKLSMGYKEKRKLKQDLAHLIIEKKENNEVNGDMKAEVLGMLAWFKSIEPDYANYVEQTLLRKFKIRNATIRNYLSNKPY